jgi:hypothetical protein
MRPFRSIIGLLAASLLMASTPNAFGGANNADLECKSASSSKPAVRLFGNVPGDFAEFELTFRAGDDAIVMKAPDDKIEVVTELAKGVFTLAVELADGRSLRLYAVPPSVKVKGGSRRLFTASFEALLLEAPKPGYKGPLMAQSLLKDIKISCTLKHSI